MEDAPYRPPYAVALAAAIAMFGLYVLTLAPTTAFWDASEYIATAHIVGIPHPPGNPLFVALARSWSLLLAPTGLPVAVRVNLFAAATSAAACGFLFLVAHRLVVGIVADGWPTRVAAGASALIGGTAFTVWNQSTVNEKVYTVSVLVIMMVSWLLLRWRDRVDEPNGERLLLLALYVAILGSTNHLMSVLPVPAAGVFVLAVAPAVLVRPSFLVRAVPLVLLGLSFNLFLPIRAEQSPVISEGDPRCEGVVDTALSVLTVGRAGCPALSSVLTREQYQKPPVTQRNAPFADQLENWFQYFDWQWSRGASPSEQLGTARLPFSLLFGLLGLVGLWAVFQADREAFLYVGVLTATLTVGLVFYLNFRYGYSLAPHVADRTLHEVRERDYFFVAGFMVWGGLVGLGLAWTWGRVASILTRSRAWAWTAPIMAVALIPLVFNGAWASRAGDYAARDWAYDLLTSVEPYGIIFTNGDNDTFPLWYLQEVEGLREDVTVVVGQYLFTSWYPKQLQALTAPGRQRPFEPADAQGLYDPGSMPSRPILTATPEEMDRVRSSYLSEDLTIGFTDLAVTFPAGTLLDRSHQLALRMIRDSIDERPIYFSGAAGMMSDIGIDRWGVRQGLVTKLLVRDLEGEQPAELTRAAPALGGEWFDYPRSRKLYQDVYRFRGFEDRDVWSDRATLNIPWYFYAMALQMADVAVQRGASHEEVEAYSLDARSFLVAAQGGFLGTPQ